MIIVLLLSACFDLDPDGDLLLNADEAQLGTDKHSPDSDGDGLVDGHEVHFHLTDPLSPDTDDDGDQDGWEVERGLDPADESSHGYTGGWPMLTIAEKASLETEPHPTTVTIGQRIKRTIATDQNMEEFDLFDLAGSDAYSILFVTGAGFNLSEWIGREDASVLEDWPDTLRGLILDGSTRAISIVSDLDPDPDVVLPADGRNARNARIHQYAELQPHLADDSMELWAFLGRPEPDTTFYLLDDRMIVRAINDFDLMLDLIEAGPPPTPEED
jgi:hypothetical protein